MGSVVQGSRQKRQQKDSRKTDIGGEISALS